jgi:hypothetical protein
MHRHRLDDNHRRAAHGALGIVSDMARTWEPVLGHVGRMRAEDDAVAQGLVSKLHRLEQVETASTLAASGWPDTTAWRPVRNWLARGANRPRAGLKRNQASSSHAF